MTALFTLADATYAEQASAGRKKIFGSVSLTNPYTAGGESITVSTYFNRQFLGGHITMINPSVSAANAGIAETGVFRGDTNSITTAVLQFWNGGLSATANAGLQVDNTIANLSSTTLWVELNGY